MTLSSRVAVVGANGAGKSTLVKMIVGETRPSNEGRCQFFIHHNLRIAYVAQHSFHHVESHYEQSPANYIAWRFKDGYDMEKFLSEGYKISPEEAERADKVSKRKRERKAEREAFLFLLKIYIFSSHSFFSFLFFSYLSFLACLLLFPTPFSFAFATSSSLSLAWKGFGAGG